MRKILSMECQVRTEAEVRWSANAYGFMSPRLKADDFGLPPGVAQVFRSRIDKFFQVPANREYIDVHWAVLPCRWK
jgi:hypothetical protein